MKVLSGLISVALLFATHAALAKSGKNKKRTVASQNELYCANSPAVKWGTYYCIQAKIANPLQLTEVSFGTCEGSDQAGESEPVKNVDFKSLKHDPNQAATSAQWKDASAFDVSSEEFGKGVMYITQETLRGSKEDTQMRLKIGGKDLRLRCAPVAN